MNSLTFRSTWTVVVVALTIIWTIYLIQSSPVTRNSATTERMKGTISSIQAGGYKATKDGQESVGWVTGKKNKHKSKGWFFSSSSSSSDRPLILYAYADAAKGDARRNLEFFITHGLHAGADFVFILNGDTDAHKLLPSNPNIRYIKRENVCYDLGAYGEVLIKDDLYKKYKRFIMLNSSIRGPFLPYWSEQCWSDMFLRRVTDEVKLVGMTVNCKPRPHVQSMIWATDSVGIKTLLFPQVSANYTFPHSKGITHCHRDFDSAIRGEVSASLIMMDAGYKVDAMMTIFHSQDDFISHCAENGYGDFLFNGGYNGTNVQPYETIFVKANRNIDPMLIDRLTTWHDKGNYSSWERCLP